MKKPLLCANWKENKDLDEAKNWVSEVGGELEKDNRQIIVCPPFPFIFPLFEEISQKNWKDFISLAAQDVSHFEEGAHTGEVAPEMIVPACKHCLVGHSERRKYFGETEKDVVLKLKDLFDLKIIPILCLANLDQAKFYLENVPELSQKEAILVYEPPDAISGGGAYKPEDENAVNQKIAEIKAKINKSDLVLYGGSVNPDNISNFISMPNIDGALIGQASLDPASFIKLIHQSKL